MDRELNALVREGHDFRLAFGITRADDLIARLTAALESARDDCDAFAARASSTERLFGILSDNKEVARLANGEKVLVKIKVAARECHGLEGTTKIDANLVVLLKTEESGTTWVATIGPPRGPETGMPPEAPDVGD